MARQLALFAPATADEDGDQLDLLEAVAEATAAPAPRTNASNGYTTWVVEFINASGYRARKEMRSEVAYFRFLDKCLDVWGYTVLATSAPTDLI